MVGDKHQIAWPEVRVERASGISEDQGVATQLLQHPNVQSSPPHLITLIEVRPPLKNGYRNSFYRPERKLPKVPFDRRHRKVRYVSCRQRGCITELSTQFPEARAQYESHQRTQRNTLSDVPYRFADLWRYALSHLTPLGLICKGQIDPTIAHRVQEGRRHSLTCTEGDTYNECGWLFTLRR